MRLRVGTSGYNYDTWKGKDLFYPEDLPRTRMLSYYAGRLPAVEINYTFRTLPTARAVAGWAAETPEDFRFALKAWQRITHHKRLRDVAEPVAAFHEAARGLGARLGPVLYQLPPNLKADLPLLEDFLAQIPAGAAAALEFRHESWWGDQTWAALDRAGAALCVAESAELETPLVRTAGFGYLRLRRPDYDERALAAWAERIAGAGFAGEVYVFFKHEDDPSGVRFAERLAALVGKPRPAPRRKKGG